MGNNSQWGSKINETNLFIQAKKKKNLGIGKKYTQSVGKTVLNPTKNWKLSCSVVSESLRARGL